jgi:YbbR domain-containing protein
MALRVDRPNIVVPVDEVSSADTAILLLPPWLRTSVGEEVSVEDLAPSSVRLSFERMEVKPATVLFRSTGALPEGLSFARPPEVTPSVVRVSGPASRLGDLTVLGLTPLDLSGIRNSASFDLPVDTAGLDGMALSPRRATVEIVLEETSFRTLPDVPVSLPRLGSDPQLQARPATVTLELSGARSVLEELDVSEIRIRVSQTVGGALVPGEEVRASLSLEGVPEVVQATLEPEWVLLRRPSGL